ncbi:Basic-leucine zipper (bZIP) transcription factor [Macrophomina phaseolina MS6]|uniref:Basic-leucine zipper (BZIP) transcription factor n=2 Tax=Macrophomina phaseolina TaxID=35725 RepID=K2R7Q0_MACPH|nr:Basic-leucine zipper (bZIP) transcription factor [Macrophomina phaseolina MS6]KAH7042804.1 hypothetical protein B0J12DRAFT_761390 [Macrophomina phaseolina]
MPRSAPTSTSEPTYSLPTTNGLTMPPEDDWTRVKDRKEKKRIQNRVAQRTYRQRIKARLGELQARVDFHEERSASLQRTDSPGGKSGSVEARGTSPASTQALPTTRSTTSPSPNPSDNTGPHTQHNFNAPHVEATDHDGLFLPPAQIFNNTLFPQKAPQPCHGHPPRALADMANQEPNMSPEFMQECLRFQMQLISKLTPPGESNFNEFFNEKDDLSLSTLGSHDLWKPADMAPAAIQQPPVAMDMSASPHPAAFQASLPAAHMAALPPASSVASSDAGGPEVCRPPAKDASLDERIEYVLECAAAAGFDGLDSLAAAYYTGTFDESSLLAAEQRLSRNRRLPKVLAEVFHAAGAWSAWERRGFYEEILQSAESMLVAECSGFAKALDAQEGRSLPQDQSAIKRLFQNEMPNLGALLTAMAAENTAVRQRDRPNAVMAMLLVLCCAGRISSSQLGTVLSGCLEGLGCGK